MQISLLFSPPPLFPQDDYFLPLESQAGEGGGELGAIRKREIISPRQSLLSPAGYNKGFQGVEIVDR